MQKQSFVLVDDLSTGLDIGVAFALEHGQSACIV